MASLRGLHPEVAARAQYAIDWARQYGVDVTVTSGIRTMAEQQVLRSRWEAGQAKYPANRPGDSAHNFGLAFDSWVPDPYKPWWTAVRQALGFRVPDNDFVHGEVPNWRYYRDAGIVKPV